VSKKDYSNKKLIQLIKRILAEESKVLKVRGGRGRGVGHPVLKTGKVSMHLGPQEEDKNVQQEKTPVKISKAFKNKKRKK
jgi:hypothetical protein